MAQDDIQGQVVDAQGNPVDGAIVELTKSYQSSPLDEQVVRRVTTDSNGNYIFEEHPDGDGTTQEWHVAAYSHDGTAYVNSFNNPGVTADLPSNTIPDIGMFQSPLYQYTPATGLDANDGQTASAWTEQLAGAGDATAVGAPKYRADQAGSESVEYDAVDDGHDFPTDGDLPTGSGPVSFAATVYCKSTADIDAVVSYGNQTTGSRIIFGYNDGGQVRTSLYGGAGNASGGSISTGQWITMGAAISTDDLESYLNGASVATDTSASPSLDDANRSIGYAKADSGRYADIYLYDLVICDARESDQAFSDYHNDRLG